MNKEKEFNFDSGDLLSEILCDKCKYGLNGDCEAEPPCKTYEAVEDYRD